jgi:hypothetical protein
MKTERKRMYRPVPGSMVIVHFNNKLIAYVNTGIDPGRASQTLFAEYIPIEEEKPSKNA